MDTICYETDDFVIAFKPHGVPTVPLKNQYLNETFLGTISLIFPDVMSVLGRNPWEGGAVHRLDTPTSGLVLFARSRDFYVGILEAQDNNLFRKIYNADVSSETAGCPEYMESYFRHYGKGRKAVRPVFDVKKSDSDRLYRTDIRITGSYAVECVITRGFRHQIRSHLAYCGIPIIGDELYGGRPDSFLHLNCVGMTFPYCGKIFEYYSPL